MKGIARIASRKGAAVALIFFFDLQQNGGSTGVSHEAAGGFGHEDGEDGIAGSPKMLGLQRRDLIGFHRDSFCREDLSFPASHHNHHQIVSFHRDLLRIVMSMPDPSRSPRRDLS
ncbi:hypothetical protein TIFTF001_041720 [Ficus carica]|uniref:Uncharacterized protein n=1 Tax=Ficus carica TaxID=3494 RepID=A0AA87Z9Y4_FICCA|nr:hypothetical protein TIFTF001_041720 [Ficus carica]